MKTNESIENKKSANKPVKVLLFVLLLLVVSLLGYGCLKVARLSKMQTDLQQQFSTTDVAVQQLLALSHAGTNIALPQIEYLIKIANINLTINNNIALAIRALQTADNTAAKLPDPAIINLRHALQHDIGALQAAAVLDIPGALMRLDNVSDQIANLSVIPEALPQPTETTATQQKPELSANASIWQKFYYYTVDKLSHIIVIQRREPTVQPMLLSASEQVYLAQSVQLLIAEAKWSVLHSRSDIYSQTLVRADKLVKAYFAHNQNEADKISKELQELQKIDLQPKIPDISMSIQAIESITIAAEKS
jgi:uroporphyrin-3 C-methyltransferase